jgi:hypothetical protein
MTSSVNEEVGVATSGVNWDVGDFKLYQGSKDDTILFTKKQPSLAKDAEGKYHFSLYIYREQTGGTYKITGGSVIFTLTSSVQYSPEELNKVKESWRTAIINSGNAQDSNFIFKPLRMESATAELIYDEGNGIPHKAHNDINVGIQGGTNTFLINLTERGAQVCLQSIKEKKGIPFAVLFSYKYLRWLPTVSAEVHLDGKKTFEHLSKAFKAKYRDFFVSVRTEINKVWEDMERSGSVTITFTGTGSPEIEELKSKLIMTFLEQALKSWFGVLFTPVPEIEPASSNGSSGFYGGANYAMKWTKIEEAVNLDQKIIFDGWSEIQQDTDVGGMALFADIDESYVSIISTQISYPASIVVYPDKMLEGVAMSWNAKYGNDQVAEPQTPTFNSEGGNKSYVITSQDPDNVAISYSAEINYKPDNWPIIEIEKLEKGQSSRQISIDTSSWVGRIKINMEIRNGNSIVPHSQVSKDEYLTVNIFYTGPHLPVPIKESMKITPNEPLEFAYPIDVQGRPSTAKISIFGIIGGNIVQAKEQELDLNLSSLVLLADKENVVVVK